MNSPFNALTVFTKFMSSPTDALEIISKIVSSPQDVLQFIKNLMDSPENAMDIMNKFMNTPAEALRLLNRILNGTNENAPQKDKATDNTVPGEIQLPAAKSELIINSETRNTLLTLASVAETPTAVTTLSDENTLIHSMLNYPSPNDVNTNILPNITSSAPTTPLSMDSGHYATPPPSGTESLGMASPLDYHSSPGITTTTINSSTIVSSHPEDQIPSTSTVGYLSPPSEVDAAAAAEFASEHFDIKTFIQNSFPENATGHYTPGDSLNSLESVLTEVIRIEFQAFNNLPPEPRVKQENYMMGMQNTGCMSRIADPYACAPIGNCTPLQQPLQTQPSVCSPSSVSMSRDLNDTELMKLRELKLASEALYLPVDDDLSVLMSDDRIKVS